MNPKPIRSSPGVQVSGHSDKLVAALDAIAAGGTPASPTVPGGQTARFSTAAASAPAPPQCMSYNARPSGGPSVPRRIRVMDEITG